MPSVIKISKPSPKQGPVEPEHRQECWGGEKGLWLQERKAREE